MNDLEDFVYNGKHKLIHKFAHYLDIYERHFVPLRGQKVCVVEVGVGSGGSLQMWRRYFKDDSVVYGVDISTENNWGEGIVVIQGDQGDRDFWKQMLKNIPPIDIFIDDGSHRPADQIVTFQEVFPHMSAHGVYICEDIQTSYQHQFGGGYKDPGNFIEFCKRLLDQLNAWCAEPGHKEFVKTDFTRSTFGVHFYPYMVVIEKRPMDQIMRSPLMIGDPNV